MRLTTLAMFIFAGILVIPAFGAPVSGGPDTATLIQSPSTAELPVVTEATTVDPLPAESSHSLGEEYYYWCSEAVSAYDACVSNGGYGCSPGDETCCEDAVFSETYEGQECDYYGSAYNTCVEEYGESECEA